MAENPLTKLPLAGQLGVAVGVAALIGGAFYYFYWQDAVLKEEKLKKDLSTLEAEVRVLEVYNTKLPELEAQVRAVEAKLETLKRILPPEKETPDLMKKVQYLAAQSNLMIKRFTPVNKVGKDFYEEHPISVDVEGTYHNLGLFFEKVGRLSRLVNIGTVKIKTAGRQTASNTISASCVATTFVYKDDAKPAGASAPPKK